MGGGDGGWSVCACVYAFEGIKIAHLRLLLGYL